MYVSGLAKVFWGLLLVFFDIKIQGFDILLDPLGFLIVIVGLAQLAPRNQRFSRASTAAVVLLVLSILEALFLSESLVQYVLGNYIGGFFIFVISTSANLLFLYYLCRGIEELSQEKGLYELAKKTRKRWSIYLWTSVALFLASLILRFLPMGLVALLGSIMLVIWFVVYLYILLLIREADKSLLVSVAEQE